MCKCLVGHNVGIENKMVYRKQYCGGAQFYVSVWVWRYNNVVARKAIGAYWLH